MSKRVRDEPQPPPAAEIVQPGTPDELQPYRDAIASLKGTGQQLADMIEVRDHLESEQARLGVDRERLLESASATDQEGDIDALTRLAVKSEVLTRKLKHLTNQIADAEEKSHSVFVTVSASLTSLWRTFCQWLFNFEKERLVALMVFPYPQLPLEQTISYFKSVTDARLLEPTGGDVASLTKQADALLAAIGLTAFRLTRPGADRASSSPPGTATGRLQ